MLKPYSLRVRLGSCRSSPWYREGSGGQRENGGAAERRESHAISSEGFEWGRWRNELPWLPLAHEAPLPGRFLDLGLSTRRYIEIAFSSGADHAESLHPPSPSGAHLRRDALDFDRRRAAQPALDRATSTRPARRAPTSISSPTAAGSRRNTIPPDKTNLGSFGMLGDKNQEVVQKIVIDDAKLVRDGEAKAGSNDWKIGDVLPGVHGHGGDGESRRQADQAGARRDRGREDDRRRREAVRQSQAAAAAAAVDAAAAAALAPFSLGPQTDPKNSKMVILSANQGGLVLNREDYLGTNDRAPKRRADYVDHVTRSLVLIGESDAQAQTDAKTCSRSRRRSRRSRSRRPTCATPSRPTTR